MNYTPTALTNKIAVAPMSETDVWIIGIFAAFVLVVLAINLTLFFHDFLRELRLLNMEINRSEGREREHYRRQRKRLWLSLIPFIKY